MAANTIANFLARRRRHDLRQYPAERGAAAQST
jgi:hypothetical protein